MAEDDTYSVAETAKVLRVSERRIQQLVSSGDLAGYQRDNGYYRVYRYAVNERRNSETAKGRRSRSAGSDQGRRVEALEAEIRELYERVGRSEAQLELTVEAESTIRDQLAREQARADTAESEARGLREALEASRRPWYWRWFGGKD